MKETPGKNQELLARAYALANDDETLALYQDWAKTYDETMLDGLGYLTPRKTAGLLADYLKDNKKHIIRSTAFRILDVGAGTGLAGENLAKLGFSNIDALDYSAAMLGVARARIVNTEPVYNNCIQADLNNPLDIPGNTYDAMICTGLFTHAHVGARCLPELFRVLKPGGMFAATIHKDIWHEQGFETETEKLESEGILKIVHNEMDMYFTTDVEPQGYFVLWKCTK